ncbi:hypothetical protein ABIB57_004809 [Devosia sp. UYZn731]|uniref:hypothetical protein n=1 Tax=Devosia sp. UYZn731 TaxID=3156345 RepID=UPI00339A37D9
MQVNVFVRTDETQQYHLLVTPYGPTAAIPDQLKHLSWRNLAVTTLDDRLLSSVSPIIDAQNVVNGYALVSLKA